MRRRSNLDDAASRRHDPGRADAVVVLGCRLNRGGGPSEALRRRVALAAALWRDEAAPLLLLSGGNGEAAAMRALAVAAGVPEAALLCEPRSRNTAENALYGARMLRAAGIGRVILVSHRTHLLRARLLFRLAGLRVAGSAAVAARSPGAALLAVLHEAAALPRGVLRVLRGR